ncbi:MAG: DUF1343 domain-containing protein [Myxococcales bacterium]|nr:DUF1343 domain-containing protein [Myxococcales bacterium]
MSRVRTGLDRLGDEAAVARLLRGRRVGLLAHPASVDARLRPARAVVESTGAELRVLFGPEHGYAGAAQDMIGVRSEAGGDLRVRSLYGERFDDLSPSPEDLDDLDVVVIDLQDIGSRYYTYVWTAALVLEAAVAAGVEVVVLDRPNPLGGARVEGAPQRPGYRSFVGLYDVPVRHGLTIGEVLTLVCRARGLDGGALTVVDMQGWSREMTFADTGLPWVMPSPNMPTLDTARVYPGGCLIEGTRLSEGRGTTRPFELWGAPWLDGEALAADEALGRAVSGALLRPVVFEPTFHKHAGQRCGGVQVHVTDPARFRPYHAYRWLLWAAMRQRPDAPRFRTEPYEFVADRPAIDLLTGGPEYRELIEANAGPDALRALIELDARGAAAFVEGLPAGVRRY